jgi:hypothetical protein
MSTQGTDWGGVQPGNQKLPRAARLRRVSTDRRCCQLLSYDGMERALGRRCSQLVDSVIPRARAMLFSELPDVRRGLRRYPRW